MLPAAPAPDPGTAMVALAFQIGYAIIQPQLPGILSALGFSVGFLIIWKLIPQFMAAAKMRGTKNDG